MARCCGGATTCGCLILNGSHISIIGSGTSQDPFVVGADIELQVTDNTTFDMGLSGSGTISSPWTLSMAYAATAKLDDLPDINAPTPTNNHVLGWDSATSKWTNRAPTTASPGSVLHDTTLAGDGSAGLPLGVVTSGSRYVGPSGTGIGLTDVGMQTVVRHFVNTTTRAAAAPAAALNGLSILDSNPGEIDYWDGTQWRPVNNGVTQDYDAELLALSGSYATDDATTSVTRQVSASTDASGVFEVISAADLTTASGVLSVMFQETGSVGYKAVVNADVNRVVATAYSLADGSPLAFQAVSGTAVALLY